MLFSCLLSFTDILHTANICQNTKCTLKPKKKKVSYATAASLYSFHSACTCHASDSLSPRRPSSASPVMCNIMPAIRQSNSPKYQSASHTFKMVLVKVWNIPITTARYMTKYIDGDRPSWLLSSQSPFNLQALLNFHTRWMTSQCTCVL